MAELDELLITLRDVVERLEDLGVDYMVTGSMAMSTYATARTTMDIDVIAELRDFDAARIERRFAGDYYVDAVLIKNAQARNSMFNVLNMNTGVKVDFIIRKPSPFEEEKFSRRRRSIFEGVEFWIIGKDDLVLSKLSWAKDSHSELQFRDIRNLIESGVDDSFIASEIDRQGLLSVWDAFLEWKTRIEK